MFDRTENRSLDDAKQLIEQSSFENILENFRTSTKFQSSLVALLGPAFDTIENFHFPPPPKTTLETRVWRGFFERNVEIKNPEYNELVVRKFRINPYVGVLREPENLPRDRVDDNTSHEDYLLLREFQNKEWAIDTVASGVKLAKEGKYHEAIRQYDHALEIYGKCKEAFIARGAALANTGAYFKAVDEFKKALEIDPDHSNAQAYLKATLDKIKTENLIRTEFTPDKQELVQQKREFRHGEEDIDHDKSRSKKKHKKEKSRKKRKKKGHRHSRHYDSDESEDSSDYSNRSKSPLPDERTRSRSPESRISSYSHSHSHSHRHQSRKINEYRKADQKSQYSRSRSPTHKEDVYKRQIECQQSLPEKPTEWQHYGPEKIDIGILENKQSKEDRSSQQDRENVRERNSGHSSYQRSHRRRDRSRSRGSDHHKDRRYRR